MHIQFMFLSPSPFVAAVNPTAATLAYYKASLTGQATIYRNEIKQVNASAYAVMCGTATAGLTNERLQ